MKLVLIRHGIAQPAGEARAAGRPDQSRPLTEKGRRRIAQAAVGLRCLEPNLARIISSPLGRAVQTAQTLAYTYGIAVETDGSLTPGTPLARLGAILGGACKRNGPIALVGHEPELGLLTGWWLCGTTAPVLLLKKGGVCRIDFRRAPERGAGTLVYHLPPRLLRWLPGAAGLPDQRPCRGPAKPTE